MNKEEIIKEIMSPFDEADKKIAASMTPKKVLLGALILIGPVWVCLVMAMNQMLGWLGWLVAGVFWITTRYYYNDSRIMSYRMKAGAEAITKLSKNFVIAATKMEIAKSNLTDPPIKFPTKPTGEDQRWERN